MERLGDILKKQKTRIDILKVNTGTWSNDSTLAENDAAPTCPLCHGARFVHPLAPSGKPDYGRIVPCRCAQMESVKEKQAQIQKYSNLGSLSRFTFNNLLPAGKKRDSKDQGNFTQAYEAARIFAAEPKGWLIFIGPTGCGKTHLVCAIANYRVSLSQPALYMGVADLLDHLRSTFHPDSYIACDDLFERVKNSPLLILDDLTTAGTTAWAKGKMEQLLNYRFNIQLPTVITSHVPIDELDENLQGHLTDPDFCSVYVIQTPASSKTEQQEGLELPLLKKMTFENFDYKRLDLQPEQRENIEQAYQKAFNFAQSPEGWLILLGDNGCGKTHLAAAIGNRLRETGKPVLFIVVPDLLDHLRSAFGPESRASYDELFERVKRAQVLILDDFGEQSATSWAQEKLYQLINYRYNARLATVITTCNTLDEIESRISSRMMDPSLGLVFNITATDYRGDRKAHKDAQHKQRYKQRSQKQ